MQQHNEKYSKNVRNVWGCSRGRETQRKWRKRKNVKTNCCERVLKGVIKLNAQANITTYFSMRPGSCCCCWVCWGGHVGVEQELLLQRGHFSSWPRTRTKKKQTERKIRDNEKFEQQCRVLYIAYIHTSTHILHTYTYVSVCTFVYICRSNFEWRIKQTKAEVRAAALKCAKRWASWVEQLMLAQIHPLPRQMADEDEG